jgi:putative component of toxin-antitoxin plasmid stabilization module
MRIHFGPGYRAYFTRRGKVVRALGVTLRASPTRP